MHLMSESASIRSRRRTETTRALIRAARRMTAERGLTGFTVEEVCDACSVSRRTFFNYFASKDDAVLGVPLDRSDDEAVAAFLAGGGPDGALSATLLVDLADLAEARWRSLDLMPETAADLFSAVTAEPRLLSRMLELGSQGEHEDARLVRQREALTSGDVRAEVAALLIGALVRSATSEFLASDTGGSFSSIFRARIDAARDIFASQDTPTGTHEHA